MSVIRFDSEEFADILRSLKWLTFGYDNSIDPVIPLDHSEWCEAEALEQRLGEKRAFNKEIYLQNKLVWWIQRVSASNQMAYIWQYAHNDSVSKEIEKLDMESLNGKQLPTYKLYSLLRSLRYNLYTNGGNCFIQEKDLTFLNGIISGLERREATRKFEQDKESIEAMQKRLSEVKA